MFTCIVFFMHILFLSFFNWLSIFYSLLDVLNSFYLNNLFCLSIFELFANNVFFISIFGNFSWYFFDHISAISLNKELIVGYYSIHPFLLYLGFILFICLVYSETFFLYVKASLVFIFLFVALVLGGYWGFGNTVWGFFWVNDAIEVLLLFLTITSITFFHCYRRLNLILIVQRLLLLAVIFLFLFRLGMLFSRHNFFETPLIDSSFYLYFVLIFSKSLIIFFFYFYSYVCIFYFVVYFVCYEFELKIKKFIYDRLILHLCYLNLSLSWLINSANNLTFVNKYLIFNAQIWVDNSTNNTLQFFQSSNFFTIKFLTNTFSVYSYKYSFNWLLVHPTYVLSILLLFIVVI